MQFFNEEAAREIAKRLSGLKEPVAFILFVTEEDPEGAEIIGKFLDEVRATNRMLSVEKLIVEKEGGKAKEYGVYAVPCFAISARGRRVMYYGVPMGHEFSTFLLDIVDIATGKPNLPSDIVARIRKLGPAHLQVFVSDSCPYCPQAAKVAHDMAILNPAVQADVIDTAQFRPLAGAFGITSVPTTVVDRRLVIRGAIPLDELLAKMDEMKKS